MTMEDTLKALEEDIKTNGTKEEHYATVRRFCASTPIDESAISKREKELDVRFPPSYRDALKKYGEFTLGERDKKLDHLVFRIWPLSEHRSALAHYAEDLECDPTAEAVAEEIGMEEDTVAVLAKVILIGSDGHEDYVGFDLRTQNPQTMECDFGLCLRDDCEIEALSEEEAAPLSATARGFDEWLPKHIKRRRKG
jgi:hypothetical protein